MLRTDGESMALNPTARMPETRHLLALGEPGWGATIVGKMLNGRSENLICPASVERALQYLREQPVDLILVHAQTPACGRWVEQLTQASDVPVIAIGETDAVDAALVAGATDYLTEPYSRAILIRRLEFALETGTAPPLESSQTALAKLSPRGFDGPEKAVKTRSKTAHWELNASDGELTWSPSVARVLDPETAAHCCNLTGLMHLVDAADRAVLQHDLQRLADGRCNEVTCRVLIHGLAGDAYQIQLDGEALHGADFIFGTVYNVDANRKDPLETGFVKDFDYALGLPRRLTLTRRVARMMDQLISGVTAVLTVDTLGLEQICGHYGHEVGTSMQLSAIARMRDVLPPESVIAVLGDHRFGVALENMLSSNAVFRLAASLQERLGETYYFDEQPLRLQPAVGIAISSSDADEAGDLIKCSATAADQAGADPARAIQFYAEQALVQRQDNKLKISIEGYLYNALDNGELELYYQPQVDVAARAITGFEALLRWTNPVLGRVAPVVFIPIAEQNGLISSIGNWVMYEAARQMSVWRAAGLGETRISINLSPKQLQNDEVEKQLTRVSRQFNLPPSAFDLEVTETTAMGDALPIQERLGRMRNMGASVSLDDFGTRYSALSHLQDLDVDCLKIDKKFVGSIGRDDERSGAIADALVSMAKMLDKSVIAEGVETLEQLQYLQKRGCNRVQGFYFCEPVNAETATQLLAEGFAGLVKRQKLEIAKVG